ncbi:hypothetical protein WIW90_11570 [Sulfolobaceae archaeon RB850M]
MLWIFTRKEYFRKFKELMEGCNLPQRLLRTVMGMPSPIVFDKP